METDMIDWDPTSVDISDMNIQEGQPHWFFVANLIKDS